MGMYIAIDECFMKGDDDMDDSHFLCVVIEAYIYRTDEKVKSKFTLAECDYHDIISNMIDNKLGSEVVEGYWTHALKSMGRKLKEHGYCERFADGSEERGAVLFVEYDKITRSELQRIVDNAHRVVEARNEGGL